MKNTLGVCLHGSSFHVGIPVIGIATFIAVVCSAAPIDPKPVVIENGGAVFSFDWELVQRQVASGLTLVRQTEAGGDSALRLQKGISVELPVTSNAVPVPKADQEGSLIVTVTHHGNVYLGVSPISTRKLAERIKRGLASHRERTLFVKADAHTSYANLVKVLDCVRTAGVEGLTLLTAQGEPEEPGTLSAPKGLEFQVLPADASMPR